MLRRAACYAAFRTGAARGAFEVKMAQLTSLRKNYAIRIPRVCRVQLCRGAVEGGPIYGVYGNYFPNANTASEGNVVEIGGCVT